MFYIRHEWIIVEDFVPGAKHFEIARSTIHGWCLQHHLEVGDEFTQSKDCVKHDLER
jgi:hypothetical protein